jgi:hypothetical protein
MQFGVTACQGAISVLPGEKHKREGGRKEKLTFSSKTKTFLLSFFLAALGLELRTYPLSYSASPFFVMGYSREVSQTICPGLALNCDPPDLCFLSSWDYKREPLAPTHSHFLIINLPSYYTVKTSAVLFFREISQCLGKAASP